MPKLFLLLIPILIPFTQSASGQTADSQKTVCHECIRIRLGAPMIEQGPGGEIADNPFSEIQLPNGLFRGFTSAGESFAIDGHYPADMRGPLRKILSRGAPGSYDACGQWLHHAELSGNTVLGWIHDETACNYAAHGQTYLSSSLAISSDYGLTWKNLGTIINNNDPHTPNKMAGEGGCTAVDGKDGYYYAYCRRPLDNALIVARAPVSNPGPGKWMKFFQGRWEQPGLGGNATNLMSGLGHGRGLYNSVARWTTTGETIVLGGIGSNLAVYLSTDHTTFTNLREPLLTLDPGSWNRPDPSEVLAYSDLIDSKTGSNQLSNSWMLTYMYVQPNEGFTRRYLVFRKVDVTIADEPVVPQVGMLLARWYNPAQHDRWSTTAAVPEVNGSAYQLEASSGYLMTIANAGGKATVELEDCVSKWPGRPDHLLGERGFCEAHDFQRLRTAGFAYSAPQEQTVPLYLCDDEQDHSHFASNQSDCEKLGTMEHLLGYVVSR
jgi:hypothetical protein